eukprot:PITA_04599
MGCITSVSFVVLINGAASPFFKGKRGLRQGYPLSSLLFLLVVEGLSQLILKAKREGTVKGLEVAVNMFISHLLFVDDILLFSNGNMTEIKELKKILELFMKATGMEVNYKKSQLILEGFNRKEKGQITSILPFDVYKLEDPFKYIGFWLKSNAYKKQDWNWLLAKIEARIMHWRFNWISKAGSKEDFVLPWVTWEKVERPKEWGGWGIKEITTFNPSLAAESGWIIIKMDNLWMKVVKQKYIDLVPLEEWIRNLNKKGGNVLEVWKETIEAFKVIEQGLAWQVGNGGNLQIGKDPWVGCNENFSLSQGLIRHLASKGILFLSQVEKTDHSTIWGQAWKSREELDLRPHWWNDWKAYTQELSKSNVKLKDRTDRLVWAHADSGTYSPKFRYKFLMSKKGWGDPKWWAKPLWKLKCPEKAKFVFWCILKRKVPTWEILQSIYKQGPGRYSLCKNDSETIRRLFIECPIVQKVWLEVGMLIQKQIIWEGDVITDVWDKWWRLYPEGNLWNLPPIISWGIWIAKNRCIFLDKETPVETIVV